MSAKTYEAFTDLGPPPRFSRRNRKKTAAPPVSTAPIDIAPPGWRELLETRYPGNAINLFGHSWNYFTKEHPALAREIRHACS